MKKELQSRRQRGGLKREGTVTERKNAASTTVEGSTGAQYIKNTDSVPAIPEMNGPH